MDKKSKDPMRRYKKSRHAARSSSESSSSETDTGSSSSYSSSDSEHNRINERHRKKKSTRRAPSSSGEDRRKRDKRDHCQKKLEAKRNHIKRKLKEAKLKKRAAAALSSGHGNRSLTPTTQAKLKKLAERKHLRAASKEQREREKMRNVQRDRERDHHRMSRSPPTTTTKIRIHQDVKRMKSPGMGGNGGGSGNNGGSGGGVSSSSSSRMHHQLMSREKIIIQTRTRDRTPSLERERERIDRQRHEHKQQQRHDDLTLRERERRDRERERAEREAARDKERAEALARCQERQRERERLAREKMRREEEEKKYSDIGSSGLGGNRMRQLSERNIEINGPYGSRERSLEASERSRHMTKRDLDPYDREPPEYIESERHNMFDDVRRYGGGGGGSSGSGGGNIIGGSNIGGHHHRRRELSPVPDHYQTRLREPSRDLYPEDEREHVYKRSYAMEVRYPSRERETWHNTREIRDHELHDARDFRDAGENHYGEERDRERERLLRERERPPASGRNDWKGDWERNDWDESGGGSATPVRAGGFVSGPKRGLSKHQAQSNVQQVQQRAGSESNWDTDEQDTGHSGHKPESSWLEHGQRERSRPWQSNDWRDPDDGFSGSSGGIGGNGRGGSETGLPGHISHQQSVSGPPSHHMSHPRSERGGRGFRRGGGHSSDHLVGERSSGYRPHPPPLMTLPVQPPGGYHSTGGGGGSTRGFMPKRLTYTNPGYGKKHIHPHSAAAAAAAAAQQRHSPQPSTTPIKSSSAISSSSAQASAVAAATTAVAAAKAAAQSSANATTNPGILGKVSKIHATSSSSNITGGNSYAHDTEAIESKTTETTAAAIDDKLSGGELSEISDSDDDILNTTEKVRAKSDEPADGAEPLDAQLDVISTEESKSESTGTGNGNGNGIGNAGSVSTITSSSSTASTSTTATAAADTSSSTAITNKHTDADDEVLDFEEISDGELEEDARLKGIGDALGVDWQGLIAETRAQAAEYATTQNRSPLTTGKQSWLPYHIILDVGVSLRMAGTYYGQQLLNDARLRLQEEHKEAKRQEQLRKQAKKAAAAAAVAAAVAAAAAAALEAAKAAATATDSSSSSSSTITTTTEASSGSVNATELYNGIVNNNEAIKPSSLTLPPPPPQPPQPLPLVNSHYALLPNDVNVDIDSDDHDEDDEADEVPFVSSVAEPLACVQIAVRNKVDERQKLIANVCGPNSRALSARADLRLRRQLCALPANQSVCPQALSKVSERLKAHALYLFQERSMGGHHKYKWSKLLDKVTNGTGA